MYSDSESTLEVSHVLANTPDKVATMPDIVGIVAADTPEAMDRAFPPEKVIASKTWIIPVTVPSNPSRGSREMNVLIMIMLVLRRSLTSEINCSRMRCARQDVRSGRVSH